MGWFYLKQNELSYDAFFGNLLLSKQLSLKWTSSDDTYYSGKWLECQMDLWIDCFVHRMFQVSNGRLTQQLVKHCQPVINKQAVNGSHFYVKRQWIFLQCQNIHISFPKNSLWKILLLNTSSTQGTNQSVICPCKPIIFLRVQLNSW